MFNQRIFVLGYEEFVLMMGLLGIEGKIIENSEEFRKEFDNLIKNTTINMIIIAVNLSENDLEYLLEFKISSRKPFIFLLPDIFKTTIESQNPFISKIYKLIGQDVS